MTFFPPSLINELHERLLLSDIVRRYVHLIKRGQDFIGLCPFHKEKTPSFKVNDSKGFFHCFGCNTHGDLINFVMKINGWDFTETINSLCKEANLEIPQSNHSGSSNETPSLYSKVYKALDAASLWFYNQLQKMPAQSLVKQYINQRGLNKETQEYFKIGWAPDNWRGLFEELSRQGFDTSVLLEAGLIIQSQEQQNFYDRFRNRIIFPIHTQKNKIVGFGGRVLNNTQPKYLNSPETIVFHKGYTLYGEDKAFKKISAQNQLLVVEGYIDVLSLVQAGFVHTVAPLGTALTSHQISKLWSVVDEPIVCFDGDTAGQQAAIRIVDIVLPLLQPSKSLRFAFLPQGEDPDSLIRNHGIEAFNEIISQAITLDNLIWNLEFYWQPLDTPERWAGFNKRLHKKISIIQDKNIKDMYKKFMNNRYNTVYQNQFPINIRSAHKLNNFAKTSINLNIGGEAARLGTQNIENYRFQLLFILLIRYPELIYNYVESLANLVINSSEYNKLRQIMIDYALSTPHLTQNNLLNHLEKQGYPNILETFILQLPFNSLTKADISLSVAENSIQDILQFTLKSKDKNSILKQ
ncbi:MAG: DNA primase [Alphaproteobacteria bacterium]|nr:DNA primase [Alphaproteobacteria bacterium]